MEYNTARDRLTQEYIDRYKLFFWILKVAGFSRVEVKDGKLVGKSTATCIYAFIPFMLTNVLFFYMMAAFMKNKILSSEILMICQLIIMFNSLIFNITFFHKTCGSELISKCIDIDCRIGADDTKFLRDLESRFCHVLMLFALIVMIIVSTVVVITYNIPESMYVSNGVCFTFLAFPYCDYIYMLRYHLFISLRMQYLNVALERVTKTNPDYLVDSYGSLLWNKKYDVHVKFHEREEPEQIYYIIRILIDLKHFSMKVDNFSLLLNTMHLILSHFVMVEHVILYIKSKGITMIVIVRLLCSAVWFISNWALCLGITLLTSRFYKQTQQTILMCNYVQLKTSTSKRLLKLTKRILSMFELHDIRTQVYGMYVVDTGLLLRITAAIFVYVSMQLQLSFPTHRSTE